ncbi:SDR family oxidoreductase [Saccharothrix sp. S26]|uniref:SDR family oxidoreductase n=1 Tax=Saccharothrix sp. S26 TaxID=2907215 RepID=UPI001F30D7C9|nr:SDR family oxidoreductase [Saccharothrix sp. S26]MCE6996328.1 SDR family oxidoreductase [Saccharothrix sp. S26]
MPDNPTIALITGANKGIGRETARQLAALGCVVLLGARDEVRGKQAADELAEHGDVRFLQLDVTDDEQVAAAAHRIEEEFGRLDVLVNNAGVIAERNFTAATAQVDQVRATYETNVFGVVRVMNALLPLLLRSPAPRVVNLSSFLGSLALTAGSEPKPGVPTLLGYSTSKTALNALTVQYAAELRDHPIKINSADPGYVSTDLNRHTGDKTVEQGAAVVVRLATLAADGPTGGFFGEHGEVPW